ncbi:hypothetical protein [Apilactobacillus xinyiensis]|uniref:hypothetical protein n=1 Tax=Apilactobacillus xinyiensis TaxID=2841032 RepID=UPI001C7D32B7|nr:hypothetical protein [Apilactobacillus xinyiensis]
MIICVTSIYSFFTFLFSLLKLKKEFLHLTVGLGFISLFTVVIVSIVTQYTYQYTSFLLLLLACLLIIQTVSNILIFEHKPTIVHAIFKYLFHLILLVSVLFSMTTI